jgi:FAD/FMN-containing dehydrogenase
VGDVETRPGWAPYVDKIKGEIVLPAHAAYEEARLVWNVDIDKRPLAIVRCTDIEDVIRTVRFARDEGIDLAVRGGGHSYPGHSASEGGIILDLAQMDRVTVNDDATVTVQGGALLGAVDRATTSHGFVMPAGIVSHTGMAGLALGGGFGYLSRSFGMTCDQFIRLQMVTAAGDVVYASETENPELFWALKGGGGNFGIVTEFHCRLNRLPEIQAGWLYFPMSAADEILRASRRLPMEASRNLATYFMLGVPSEGTMIPVDAKPGDRLFGVRVVYGGSAAGAEAALKPLRSIAQPLADLVTTRQFTDVQTEFDGFAAHGKGWYMKAGQSRELSDDFITKYIEESWKHHSYLTSQTLVTLGGAINDVDEMAAAYSSREAEWHIGIEVGYTNREEREHIVGWTRQTYETVVPLLDLQTSYVNMFVSDLDPLEKVYGPAKYKRLRDAKTAFDPDNFFRGNSNIPPN